MSLIELIFKFWGMCWVGGVHAHVNLVSLVKSILQSGAMEDPIGGKQQRKNLISNLWPIFHVPPPSNG